MADTKNVPIFRDMTNLTKLLLSSLDHMAVKHRRTLGDRIMDTAYGMFRHLQYAYDAPPEERIKYLDSFSTDLDLLMIYLRLATEMQFMPVEVMARVIILTENISKQLYGWKRSTKGCGKPEG